MRILISEEDNYVVRFIFNNHYCSRCHSGWLCRIYSDQNQKKGIETVAVVTNIEESWESVGEADSLCYTYTVEYKNYEGKMITAALGGMSDTNKKLSTGDRIMIKYLEDKQDYPILVKKFS